MNFRKLLARPELGACFATILIFIVFALIAGKQGFLSAQGTINYLEVGAQLGILASAVALLRGLALSSTSKHLHGNEEYRFGKPDGVALVIDLARIPQGEQDVSRAPPRVPATDWD